MNSKLYDNEYQIPRQILDAIKIKLYASSDAEGIKRAKNLVKSGKCTYQNLKRLKNFFDNFNPSNESIEQFELAGGKQMRNFVDTTLQRERNKVEHSQNVRQDIDVKLNDPNVKAQNGSVNLREQEEEPKYKNAIGIIFNVDNEILILKRSSYKEQWMPNKFGLVGGGIEEGEEPIDALKREVLEETGLNIDNWLDKGCIQRNMDSKEYLFLTLYKGNNNDIKLNKEHTDYVWSNFNLLKNHDCVPNLEEYVKLTVEKYD
jgi:8-oxo-dGTP pyrophosphatase MutT (NUDIX family)